MQGCRLEAEAGQRLCGQQHRFPARSCGFVWVGWCWEALEGEEEPAIAVAQRADGEAREDLA